MVRTAGVVLTAGVWGTLRVGAGSGFGIQRREFRTIQNNPCSSDTETAGLVASICCAVPSRRNRVRLLTEEVTGE